MNDKCPVCGGGLTVQVTGCSTCPMSHGCGMLCCENCGYQTVPNRSAIVDRLKALFSRKRSHASA